MNETKSKRKIIVFGMLFWYPLVGVTYQFLNYLLGLRRLGYMDLWDPGDQGGSNPAYTTSGARRRHG